MKYKTASIPSNFEDISMCKCRVVEISTLVQSLVFHNNLAQMGNLRRPVSHQDIKGVGRAASDDSRFSRPFHCQSPLLRTIGPMIAKEEKRSRVE
jgi:hypothetical protein